MTGPGASGAAIDAAALPGESMGASSSSSASAASHQPGAPTTEAASASTAEAAIPAGFLGTLVPVRRTYVDEVPEELKCPICYDGAANCSTRCGHSFCLHCLYSHITTRIIHQQSTACPMCRSANAGLGISSISGERSARTRALRVRCLGYEGGCRVEGPLSEVEAHEATCPNVLIFCRFRDAGCSTPVLRKEASLHENRCRFNPAFLPNVSKITDGRFPGEFHVVLEQVPLLAVRAIGMAGDPNMSSNLSALGLLFKGITTLQPWRGF
ncbi:zinc finger (c3hc4 type ring finger) domain-containing protein [Cyclospora cayetanensis]|uniref:Zinc finger (C3hc4 type ring finger) domain-containing protein n=1 Tax=Cyclospora cayetanensis TaxID=88456 RepID=A0A1D3CXI3_9EIME|nr:zinc finger (c3hc4 type ring finger) domain-containing protein [Cyclospora cayetanensis]